MKALLKFNLEDLDDRMNHFRCIKSLDLALCLWDFQNILRNLSKYPTDDIDQGTVDRIRDELADILDHRDIRLDELTR